MKHDLGLGLLEHRLDLIGVAKVDELQRRARVEGPLQVLALATGQVVDHGDLIAPRQQAVDEV